MSRPARSPAQHHGSGRLTRRPVPRVRLLVRRHRRLLVALCLAAASGLAVDAATAAPPPGVEVTAAARDLPAGHLLEAGDLRRLSVPRAAVPGGALGPERLVGDVLASAVRSNEVLTDLRVLTSAAAGIAPGHVALPVPLGNDGVARWLRPGVRVRVLAVPADPLSGTPAGSAAQVVAREVVVLDVPTPQGGGLGLGGAGPGDAVVLVSVPEQDTRAVAAAAAGGWLTVALLP